MTKLFSVRILLSAALALSLLAAAVPAVLSVFELGYLRDSIAKINGATARVKEAREVVDKIAQSMVAFTAVALDIPGEDRSNIVAETDRQFSEFSRAVEQVNDAGNDFISSQQQKKLAEATASLQHSWEEIKDHSPAEITAAEKAYHFLEILDNSKAAQNILVMIEAAATRAAKDETQSSFERLSYAGTLLVWIMLLGVVISVLVSLGIYHFASATQKANAELARRDRQLTEQNEQLKYLAHYDQLTGLPNRVTLHGELEELINPSVGPGRHPTSIVMLDLDGFKDINDTLGHSTGDQLLKEVAQRLSAIAGHAARVYRLGGDEFVVIFPKCGDPCVLTKSVEAMLEKIAEHFEINDQLLHFGASAGIAIAPAGGSNVEDLIANADLALYDAKSSGGHTYRLFLPVLRAQAQARRELDSELRRAFSENEFELYFQPQLRLSDGAVVGAEALLRWRHPERGILAPGLFIEALARSPVVREVGSWVLRTACERAAAWRAMGLPPVRIGVNLFPAQFYDGALLTDVEDALLQTGLPTEALELEITENIALGHDEALAQLRTLREKGVHFALDDFGTGYASLSYLTRYPLSRIKIDQSFVRKITDKTEDTAIIRSIIVMAHNLGLEVIAEGVETPAQAAFLQAEGCEEAQGFLYAKPLPGAEFEEFVRSSQIDSQKRAAGCVNPRKLHAWGKLTA